ncbi:MAG: hypothetical protein DWQ05_12815 [Calditrichaeota bacterium]|nr:MAG: hypothetical protein DWQ05_12815 [Calditrichota bacterium]
MEKSQNFHNEFAKIEFEQTLITFRSMLTLAVQLSTLMMLANVTLIGYAFKEHKSAIFLIGAFLPVVLIIGIRETGKVITPLFFSAFFIEKENDFSSTPWHITFTALLILPENLQKKFDQIHSECTNSKEMAAQLKGIVTPFLGTKQSLTFAGLLLFSLGQLAISVYLYYYQGWQFI